jgi:ferredoxin-NADP reductase
MKHGPAMHMSMGAKKLASFEVALKGKRQIAESTYEFVLEKPANFHFKAGQHVRMSLINPPETDAEGHKRFLTMASTPNETDLVFAMRMRDTAFKRVLSHMQIGEKVLIQKLVGDSPHGAFMLHEDASIPAVFIVGGIGIVPAYSMIKDALQRKLAHNLILFYANRRPEDAPYLKELQTLAKENPNFKLVATMTEPEKSVKAWKGETGLINRAMLDKYLDGLKSPIYYESGLSEMVKAMQAVLADAGVPKDNVRAEEFGAFMTAHASERPPSKSKWVIAIIAAFIIVMVTAHVVAASSLVKAAHSKQNVELQGMGLLLLAIAAIVIVKIKLIRRHRRRR